MPTLNRADLLRQALHSLRLQTLPMELFEVLVIDNGSTDDTKQVVASFQQAPDNNIRYFFDPTPGLHVGRHLGMKMAESEILVYCDDDIEAFPTWLEAIAETFEDPDVALVGGKDLPKFESEPPDWILKMWEKDKTGNKILGYLSIIDLGEERKEINPLYVFGCNFAIRKKILMEAGGFHPDAMPQELIQYRGDGESHVSRYLLEKNHKVFYHPKASVYHLIPSSRMTEEYFCKRAYSQGISDSYTSVRDNIRNHRPVKKNPAYFLFGIVQYLRTYLLLNKRREYRFNLAYRAGYEFHRGKVSHDKQLYEWVIKDHYI